MGLDYGAPPWRYNVFIPHNSSYQAILGKRNVPYFLPNFITDLVLGSIILSKNKNDTPGDAILFLI